MAACRKWTRNYILAERAYAHTNPCLHFNFQQNNKNNNNSSNNNSKSKINQCFFCSLLHTDAELKTPDQKIHSILYLEQWTFWGVAMNDTKYFKANEIETHTRTHTHTAMKQKESAFIRIDILSFWKKVHASRFSYRSDKIHTFYVFGHTTMAFCISFFLHRDHHRRRRSMYTFFWKIKPNRLFINQTPVYSILLRNRTMTATYTHTKGINTLALVWRSN